MVNNFDEKIYTVPINDQGLNLYVRLGDDKVTFGYDQNVNFLMPVTKVVEEEGNINVYLFTKKLIEIKDGIIQLMNHITSTELRNISMMLDGIDDGTYTNNEAHFRRKVNVDGESTKTELHTHLIEILDSKRFLDLVERFNGYVRLNEQGMFDFRSGNAFTIGEIKNLPGLYDLVLSQLEIPITRAGSFEELEVKVANRTRLLLDVADTFGNERGLGDMLEARILVTKVLLRDSLCFLRDNDVKYVEVSHSNIKLIKGILDSLDDTFYNDIDGIDFKFLASSSRLRPARDFRQSSRHLDEALESGHIIGFDLMGLENRFSSADLDDSYKDSIYNKLLPMVGVLNKYDKSVLRLHSGEFANTETNTENILETLVRICNDLGINIPPPEVRVGHGLHIEENKRLVDLLRLFDCIVEVNASSNFALGHVKDLREIPYQFYLDNGIRVVLSTDGGGFYSTSNGQEKMIASTFVDVEDLEKILESDRDIYSRKAGEVIHEKRVGR